MERHLNLKKPMILAVLLLLAVISFLLIADRATAVETHAGTISALDEKAETVLKLSASAAISSAAVSAIPGDTATPIAEKLADFTSYFLLILCVLYSEKYLVTILGAATFKVLIPCALALVGVSLYWNPRRLRSLAVKLAVIGLAVYFVIPISLRISDMIYRAYDATIESTMSTAEALADETAGLAESEEDKGVLSTILDKVTTTVESLRDQAADTLNRFVETLAVMIVTSCVIPILVLLFFLWVIKQLTGVDLVARFRPAPDDRRERNPR